MATKNQQEIFQPLTSAEVSVEPYIGKAEVARRMGRTVRAVEAMMRRRLIPFYKFDSRAVFRWSEIQAALAETCRVSALTISK